MSKFQTVNLKIFIEQIRKSLQFWLWLHLIAPVSQTCILMCQLAKKIRSKIYSRKLTKEKSHEIYLTGKHSTAKLV